MNTALVAESFLWHEPDDGTAAHLVSIQRDPGRARSLPGTRGSVQLRYHSLQLIPVGLLDDVPGIWRALLEAVEGFLGEGRAEVSYPGIDCAIVLERTATSARFTVGTVRHLVDAGELVAGIRSGAQAYFEFADAGHFAGGERASKASVPGRSLGT